MGGAAGETDWLAWEAARWSLDTSLCWEMQNKALKVVPVFLSPLAFEKDNSFPPKAVPLAKHCSASVWLPSSHLHLNRTCFKFSLVFFSEWHSTEISVSGSVPLLPLTHMLPLTKAFLCCSVLSGRVLSGDRYTESPGLWGFDLVNVLLTKPDLLSYGFGETSPLA